MIRCPECKYKLPIKHSTVVSTCNNCLTKVNVHSKKVVNVKPTFHHPDQMMKQETITEIEYVDRPSKSKLFTSVRCLMCSSDVSTLHATEGSILVIRTRKQVYTEFDPIKQEDVEFEKYVKFPTYLKGHICNETCLTAFTYNCNAYDDWGNVKAKLAYTPVQESHDDIIIDLGLRGEPTPESPDADYVIEYADIRRIGRDDHTGKIMPSKMGFKKVDDQPFKSIQEMAAERKKVARLAPVTQNVNPKPSKKVKDMRKQVKG